MASSAFTQWWSVTVSYCGSQSNILGTILWFASVTYSVRSKDQLMSLFNARSLSARQFQSLISSLFYVQQELTTDYQQFWMICKVFGITKKMYLQELKKPTDVPPSVYMIREILNQVDNNRGLQ